MSTFTTHHGFAVLHRHGNKLMIAQLVVTFEAGVIQSAFCTLQRGNVKLCMIMSAATT
ncbi:MAG: hypothetical protein M3Z51_05160 [Snodgrassella alvi]|nr:MULTISPECIES: hypothetical protein [unclassified Snodgrassella]MCT6881735.1 hypothetical protein [Snodgrassella alvi]